ALKESIKGREKELGVFICGGKGKTSLKTPDEIYHWGEYASLPEEGVKNLIYNSKMAAKVDNSLIQDGYNIYHHTFFFSKNGVWTVVQQGMNTENSTARRYHWFSKNIKDIVCEPHSGISADILKVPCLNMAAKESEENRNLSKEIATTSYIELIRDLKILRKHSNNLSKMVAVKSGEVETIFLELRNTEFETHPVLNEAFLYNRYLEKILWTVYQQKPENYEKLIAIAGVGPKTVRALSLVAEVIYGAPASYKDPARYSFAHGGKDGTPYPVDRKIYDRTILFFTEVIKRMKISPLEKEKLIRKLI
ncbi:MAG: DUF763 domain-containing protein, partial [Candidatus Omnitrophica bacterium]|nr:DUF763 domain-containing protein [Candidatus Omnitrophota bacterium]